MNRILYTVLLLIPTIFTLGQTNTSSPYSRFGLGELQNNVFSEFNAIGGGVTGFSSSNNINPYNPASYTSFSSNSFLLSTGLRHKTVNMENNIDEQRTNNSSFSHFAIGFPISRKVGASIGILPYSNMGYDVTSRDSIYNTDLSYLGDGGISKIYFGGAYAISNKISIGLNASYLFGAINKRKMVIFNDETFLNSRSNDKINLKGYYYELGLMYKDVINENQAISFGVTANNKSEISSKQELLIETFDYSGISETIKDTSLYTINRGYTVLPQYISFGGTYLQNNKWLIVADYSMQNWGDYRSFNQSDSLINSMRFSAGLQYTPDYNSVTQYYKRMQYSIGGSYSNTPLQFYDNQLKEMSIRFGLGIPIKRTRTKYDFSCTIGSRGTTDNNLIKEQFVIFGLGISFDAIWFVKRKYD